MPVPVGRASVEKAEKDAAAAQKRAERWSKQQEGEARLRDEATFLRHFSDALRKKR